MIDSNKKIEYVLMDPSKNITILVETDVEEQMRPSVAECLMKEEKTVEQVGFVSLDGNAVSLRMAGGEFCGNATMASAVYYAMKNSKDEGKVKVDVGNKTIDVEVKRVSQNIYSGIVNMPQVVMIEEVNLDSDYVLPVVFFDGIAHVIYKGMMEKSIAEANIQKWCDELNVEAMGIMCVDENYSKLVPLVYVKKAKTLFWENACASGSSAVGAYVSNESGQDISISLMQPGGEIIKVTVDKLNNIKLEGKVEYIYKKSIIIN